MATTHCPECDALIVVAKPRFGAQITCHACEEKLEVSSVNPLEVDYPIDYDDDWDDDSEEGGAQGSVVSA